MISKCVFPLLIIVEGGSMQCVFQAHILCGFVLALEIFQINIFIEIKVKYCHFHQ